MSVRNIDKGYIATSTFDTSGYYSTTLNFTGAFNATTNATFNKVGTLIVMTLGPKTGQPTEYNILTASLPAGYEGSFTTQTSFVYLLSANIDSQSLANYVGYIRISAGVINIVPSGNWMLSSDIQGLMNTVTLVYIPAV